MTMIKKSVGLALLAGMALPMTAAFAADLYGGGATFPAIPYHGSNFKTFSPEARLTTALGNSPGVGFTGPATISSGSILGTFSSLNPTSVSPSVPTRTSYCQTGSGTGKNVYLTTTAASNLCRDFGTSAQGFSAPQVDFAGTDSPFTVANITTFNSTLAGTKNAPVQIPAVAGAIALPFNYNGITGTLNLTIPEVCRIFRGTYTDWNQIPGLGLSLSKPITLVYRTDGSGTSFAFTNFLAANCNATQSGVSPNRTNGQAAFQANQTFSSAVEASWYSTTPVGVSGNANVVAEVNKTTSDGYIGYADPGDVQTAGGSYFTVGGASPLAFSMLPLPSTALLTDTAVSDAGSTTTGLPTKTTPSGSNLGSALLLVDPAYKPVSGYPIFAFTYLEFYNQGNNTTPLPGGGSVSNSVKLQCLVKFIYNRANAGGCTSNGVRPVLPVGYVYINDALVSATTNAAIASITP